jgi:fibronectin type 3 domain-containing protein
MVNLRTFLIFLTLLLVQGCNELEHAVTVQPLKSDDSLQTVRGVKAITDTTAVAFEWLSHSESREIAGYNLYRLELSESNNSGDLQLVAQIKNRVASHFVDRGLKPNTLYKYRLTTYTEDGRQSNGSEPVTVRTSAVIPPLHYIIPVGELAKSVKLLWRPHTDNRVSGYIVERSSLQKPDEWVEVGELHHRLDVEFIDTELSTNGIYRYRIKTKTFDGLVSEPSRVVDVRTKALPKPITDITASSTLPKEIEVSWRESDERDVTSYRIYRSSANDGTFEPVGESKSNRYSDKIVDDGKQMFYKVSAIDQYGQESLLNKLPVMGNTLFKPIAPKLLPLEITQNGIKVQWRPTDSRSLKYRVIRDSGSWGGDEVEFQSDKTEYIDNSVQPNIEYRYRVIAIDKFGIESLLSEEGRVQIKP